MFDHFGGREVSKVAPNRLGEQSSRRQTYPSHDGQHTAISHLFVLLSVSFLVEDSPFDQYAQLGSVRGESFSSLKVSFTQTLHRLAHLGGEDSSLHGSFISITDERFGEDHSVDAVCN